MHVGSAPREEGMPEACVKLILKDKMIIFLHFLKKFTALSVD